MLRTPVPKAAVDEYGHTRDWKDYVGLAAEGGHRSAVLEKAEARAVEGRPQSNFRCRIPRAVRLHRPPHGGAARPRLHALMIPDKLAAWYEA